MARLRRSPPSPARKASSSSTPPTIARWSATARPPADGGGQARQVITNARTAVADASYTTQATDRLVAYASLSAARLVTLCAAAAYPTGTRLTIVDESGACSAARTITVQRAGSDMIGGATSAVPSAAPTAISRSQSDGVGQVDDRRPGDEQSRRGRRRHRRRSEQPAVGLWRVARCLTASASTSRSTSRPPRTRRRSSSKTLLRPRPNRRLRRRPFQCQGRRRTARPGRRRSTLDAATGAATFGGAVLSTASAASATRPAPAGDCAVDVEIDRGDAQRRGRARSPSMPPRSPRARSYPFTLNDSSIAAGDLLVLNHVSGGTPGAYGLNGQRSAGAATINVRNTTAAARSPRRSSSPSPSSRAPFRRRRCRASSLSASQRTRHAGRRFASAAVARLAAVAAAFDPRRLGIACCDRRHNLDAADQFRLGRPRRRAALSLRGRRLDPLRIGDSAPSSQTWTINPISDPKLVLTISHVWAESVEAGARCPDRAGDARCDVSRAFDGGRIRSCGSN